jgi:hypothetical protein
MFKMSQKFPEARNTINGSFVDMMDDNTPTGSMSNRVSAFPKTARHSLNNHTDSLDMMDTAHKTPGLLV